MNAGREDPHAGRRSTLVLHPAEWSPPHVPGTEAMSYADAQDEGFHDFGDHDRFICLPVQYPSMAPKESTRWLMQRELGQCLERGASVLVLVPPPAEAPPLEVADDEPFNSTRQFLCEITGGLKGAVLDELPVRRRAHVTVTDLAPPHLKEHLGCCAPHFLTQFEDRDRVVLAECGRAHPKPAVLVAHVGAGAWSAIPWTKGAPSEAEMGKLIEMLDEVAQMVPRPRKIKPIPGDISRPEVRASAPNQFVRKGRVWEVCFGGKSASLPHVNGLRDIANVLLAEGRRVDLLDLLDRERPAKTKVDPIWDRLTRTEVRKLIEVAKTEIAGLEASTEPTDLGKLDGRRAELEQLERHHRASTARGGRSRPLDPRFKRAGDALRKRIKVALGKIKAEHPALCEHLDEALRAGHYRAYLPAGGSVRWMIQL